MKTRILTAVSALAIMAAAPAFADNTGVKTTTQTNVERTQQQNDNAVVTEQELEQGWNDTKKAVSDAAKDVAEGAERTYENVKAKFISNDEKADITDVTMNGNTLASNMIGATVYNGEGESIAKVHDIILDHDGNASMVVLADGEIFGLGKKVAYDYSVLMPANAEGEMIAPLSEESIDKAATFTYDAESDDENIRVMPANGYSVAELLKANLVNQKGEAIANIENVSFSNGKAENLIVGFNKVLGLGGDRAALAFSDTKMMKNASGNGYDFQLSAAQSAQFESYKKQF